MRIGVFGNCHGVALAACIERLVPGVEIHRFGMDQALGADPATIERQMEAFSECDVVFIQPTIGHRIQGLLPEDFGARCKMVVPYPMLACRSLQPDSHYVFSAAGKVVGGPLGGYHSGIVLGSFLKGLPEARALSLFNRFVYRVLGYSEVDISREAIGRDASKFGYDYSDFFSGRRGRFMHTINHPAISLVFETAVQALRKAGIAAEVDRGPPGDALEGGVIWPVYPGLSDVFQADDAPLCFRRARRAISLSLREFVAESYAFYRTAGIEMKSSLSDRVKQFIDAEVVT